MSTGAIVGVGQVAEILAVSSQRVDELRHRADFPMPVERARSDRIWRQTDIETWARDTGRV
jgi:predicted DNA-binding transcriptional regulator AlpA